MSIRAYKIKKIETEGEPSFNVGEHFDWLENIAHYSTFNNDGECVSMEFEAINIETAFEEIKDKDKKEILNNILRDFKPQDDGFVTYFCF